MSWLSEKPAKRRPLLWVEDHLYHIDEALALLERLALEIFPLLTVVCLDRPGPDTERAVEDWLRRYPTLRLAAAVAPGPRRLELGAEIFDQANALARQMSALLRPGGLILQDIHRRHNQLYICFLILYPHDSWPKTYCDNCYFVSTRQF